MATLKGLLLTLLKKYPAAKIQGHRDFSPDKNRNGKVDPWERIKECPCFDAIEWWRAESVR
jgi:N-acetyl-anhydromuramyl-L-alanine amidase AmpD